MQITTTYLRQVIKEELNKVLQEEEENPSDETGEEKNEENKKEELIKLIKEKTPNKIGLHNVLTDAPTVANYKVEILQKLNNDVDQGFYNLLQQKTKIKRLRNNLDDKANAKILKDDYEEWNEDDFDKYFRLLKLAAAQPD
jgi:hypothetical protein